MHMVRQWACQGWRQLWQCWDSGKLLQAFISKALELCSQVSGSSCIIFCFLRSGSGSVLLNQLLMLLVISNTSHPAGFPFCDEFLNHFVFGSCGLGNRAICCPDFKHAFLNDVGHKNLEIGGSFELGVRPKRDGDSRHTE
jgi:hypothetical protein